MKIERLCLKNYRCFDNLEVGFHDKLTVIVGINGSGKTSVLEGTVIALGTFFSEMEVVRDVSIVKKDVRLKAYSMGESIDVQPQYPVEIGAEGIVGDQPVCWKRSLNSEEGRTTKKDATVMTEISAEYQRRLREGDKTLVLPLVAYYGTGRLWDYHREKKLNTFKDNTKINGYLNSLDGTANIKLMMNWFRKKTIQMAQGKENGFFSFHELPIVFGAMEECFRRITGFSNVKIFYNLDTNELDCTYLDKSEQRMTIPLSQLSDGYKGTISLIADIAYRMAVLNPQLGADIIRETDGVVLIDEVDLHLHPSWQHRILLDLQSIFPKIQFIVTTHAPAVISSVKRENLVILKNNEVLYPSMETYGNDVNSILNEIMGVTERLPEIADLFKEFYRRLENKEFEEAENTLDAIDDKRNNHDKEVAACRVKLRLEKIRSRKND